MRALAPAAIWLAVHAAPSLAQCPVQQLAPPNPLPGGVFGSAVDADGDLAVVGSPDPDTGGPGEVVVYRRESGGWVVEQVLPAPIAAPGGLFGCSVAIDGDLLVVGATDVSLVGGTQGAVYFYERSVDGGTPSWTMRGSATPSPSGFQPYYGHDVDVDGDWAVVGAYQDLESGLYAGAVYVYHREGIYWSPHSVLSPADASTFSQFGYSVALSDGLLAVGAPLDSDVGAFGGAVYMYGLSNDAWEWTDKLLSPEPSANQTYGTSVALGGSLAAKELVVGAPTFNESGVGKAYAYHRELQLHPLPPAWFLDDVLDPLENAAGDGFGASVAAAPGRLIVGAPGAGDRGAVYHFEELSSAFVETSRLVDAGGSVGDELGYAVALAGEHVLAGARRADVSGTDAGAVHVFSLDVEDCPALCDAPRLPVSGLPAICDFGEAVSIHGDWAFVGAPHDDLEGENGGSARVFRRNRLLLGAAGGARRFHHRRWRQLRRGRPPRRRRGDRRRAGRRLGARLPPRRHDLVRGGCPRGAGELVRSLHGARRGDPGRRRARGHDRRRVAWQRARLPPVRIELVLRPGGHARRRTAGGLLRGLARARRGRRRDRCRHRERPRRDGQRVRVRLRRRRVELGAGGEARPALPRRGRTLRSARGAQRTGRRHLRPDAGRQRHRGRLRVHLPPRGRSGRGRLEPVRQRHVASPVLLRTVRLLPGARGRPHDRGRDRHPRLLESGPRLRAHDRLEPHGVARVAERNPRRLWIGRVDRRSEPPRRRAAHRPVRARPGRRTCWTSPRRRPRCRPTRAASR